MISGPLGSAVADAKRRLIVTLAVQDKYAHVRAEFRDPAFDVSKVDKSQVGALAAEAAEAEKAALLAVACARINQRRREAIIAKLVEAAAIHSAQSATADDEIAAFRTGGFGGCGFRRHARRAPKCRRGGGWWWGFWGRRRKGRRGIITIG